MKRYSLILAISLCLSACGQTQKHKEARTLDQLHKEFVNVMLDSTASWKQVTDVAYPFTDSLCAAMADENSLNNRMYG